MSSSGVAVPWSWPSAAAVSPSLCSPAAWPVVLGRDDGGGRQHEDADRDDGQDRQRPARQAGAPLRMGQHLVARHHERDLEQHADDVDERGRVGDACLRTERWAPDAVTTHAAMKTMLTRQDSRTTTRDGRATIAMANRIWSQPATANATPSAIHSPACDGTMARWIAPAPTARAASSTRAGSLGTNGAATDRAVDRSGRPSGRSCRSTSGAAIASGSRSRMVIGCPPALVADRCSPPHPPRSSNIGRSSPTSLRTPPRRSTIRLSRS